VPVQRCTLTLPIPLLPLWTVRPVHRLSTCTIVHFTFTYTSTPPMDRTACTQTQYLYNGALYLYLYLYSPYRPYSLYRTSVPVQNCTLPLPIPLLPYGPYSLYRASVPVQHCTLPLPIPLLPYGPYDLYRNSVPVQRCTLALPIPILPLWAVQPVQSLSACTTVYFTFTYTSTPPMDRTACTQPQCLYNGALYLYLYLYSPYGPYSLYEPPSLYNVAL